MDVCKASVLSPGNRLVQRPGPHHCRRIAFSAMGVKKERQGCNELELGEVVIHHSHSAWMFQRQCYVDISGSNFNEGQRDSRSNLPFTKLFFDLHFPIAVGWKH